MGMTHGDVASKSVLSLLQGGLDRHLSASTLKVYLAAISPNHDMKEDEWGSTIWLLGFSEMPGG